jgi:hypothetical protein
MEIKEEKLIRQLHTIYWGIFGIITVLSVLLLILRIYSSSASLDFISRYMGIYSSINTQAGISLQSAGILLLLACIPLALKLYHKKLNENTGTEEEDILPDIRKWFIIRIILITFPLLFNMVTYFYTQQVPALFCCGITFIVFFFFCRPNEEEIITIISKEK